MSIHDVTAGFRWTDSGGAQEHELRVRLLAVRPARRRRSWSLEAISGAIHTEKATQAANEITGVIRFEDQPQELLEMLSDRQGLQVTYFEQRDGEAEVEYPSILVSVDPGGGDRVALEEDPQRAAFAEYAATVRLRRVDGGDYQALLRPGESGE